MRQRDNSRTKPRGIFQTLVNWQKHIALTLLLVMSTPLLSSAAIEAGGYTMTRLSAPYMNNPMRVRAGVVNVGFCGKVGGVAFGEIAESTDGSQIQRLLYHPDRPDGQRLEALISQGEAVNTVTLPIYDWLFVPAANFAAGEQDVVVTFFGTLSDKANQAQLEKQGCRFINYNPAVDNTLMGLRLMQADLLAFHQIAPYNMNENGVNIVGEGETLQSESSNLNSSAKVQDYWDNASKQQGAQSYVICDVDQPIRFYLQSDADGKTNLVISGNPYWSCWTAPVDETALQEKVVMQALETLTSQEQMQIMEAMQQSTGVPDAIQQKMAQFAEQNAERLINEEREKTFRQLPEVSKELSRLMKEEEGGNPAVYRAVTAFMRYAALFRHARKHNPSDYQSFVQSLNGVHLLPPIETPTVITPKEGSPE
jgi:hypothetical protein